MQSSSPIAPADVGDRWELAYQRFETPEQEIRKFVRRLRSLGAAEWDKHSGILEICCGRGNGLRAWRRLGFSDVVGLDLSLNLLSANRERSRLLRSDARVMPLAGSSRDIVAVQGGLHHLATLNDLELALGEMCRVVRPSGRLIIVEPWLTPFLRIVHAVTERRIARRISPKIDALATMIDEERQTYHAWLTAPDRILKIIQRYIEPVSIRIGWGKLTLVGRRRDS